MQLRISCLVAYLVAILTMLSCQKIDIEDIAAANSKSGSSTSTTKKDDTSVDNEEVDEASSGTLQELPDGTLLFPEDSHIVAVSLSEDTDTHDVMFISLYEWNDIASFYSDVDNGQASSIAERYSEGGVKGWRIPTRDDAKRLCGLYYSYVEYDTDCLCDSLLQLNEHITSLGGRALRAWQLKNNHPAYRYLCEDGQYSFSLKSGSNITKTGAKTKYNLRLVKDSTLLKN